MDFSDLHIMQKEIPPQKTEPTLIWVVIKTELFDGEEIVLLLEKKAVQQARKEHPDKVIYHPLEVEELARHRNLLGRDKYVRLLHQIKKTFGAWILPHTDRRAA
jgi:hypothetical protein